LQLGEADQINAEDVNPEITVVRPTRAGLPHGYMIEDITSYHPRPGCLLASPAITLHDAIIAAAPLSAGLHRISRRLQAAGTAPVRL
jgi:hypothetical protein